MEDDLRTLNFTDRPEGERIGNGVVEVCPRCGRKGLATHIVEPSGAQEHRYMHLGFVVVLPGSGKWIAPLVQCQLEQAA